MEAFKYIDNVYSLVISLLIGGFFFPLPQEYGGLIVGIVAFFVLSLFIGTVIYSSMRIYHLEMKFKHVLYLSTFSLALYTLLISVVPSNNSILFIIHVVVIYILYNSLKHLAGNKYTASSLGMPIAIAVILLYLIYMGTYDVFIVYTMVLLLIYRFRHLFDHQGIILLHRMKLGIKLMNRLSKHSKILDVFSYIAVAVGFVGMLAMTVYLVYNLFDVLLNSALPGIAPVLPGIKVPGSPIVLPLWHGLISIFLVALIHEFSHGVIARRHKLKVDNTGVMMMGPFVGGAFVDIDEKQLGKASLWKQLSTLAAGPFSNILMAVLLIMLFGFSPLLAKTDSGLIKDITAHTSIVDFSEIWPNMTMPIGFKVNAIGNGTAAERAGIPVGTIITQVNGIYIDKNPDNFLNTFMNTTPNQTLVIGNSTVNWTVVTGVNPHDNKRGYIGLSSLEYVEVPSPKAMERYGRVGYALIEISFTFILWLIIISFGIGIANLIPIGPVDGGRMLLAVLEHYLPKDKAKRLWEKISLVILFIIGLILVSPFFSWIFS